jgi:outer membrane protein OmpA-like peptidoglycan-associated protein
MNIVIKPLAAVLGCIALVGCAGMELEKAQMTSPSGSDFSAALYKGYVKLATDEFDEYDFKDSDVFALKAMAAARSENVQPQEIAERSLPADKVGTLTSARKRLTSALSAGAADKIPGATANAQVMFDCWMQEQEENIQPEDISACRAGFMSAMAEVDEALKPKMVAKPQPAPQPKPAPAPEPVFKPVTWVIYFDFDSATLTPAARNQVRDIAEYAGKNGARVVLSGHTDRAGSGDYNARLSAMRSAAVADAIRVQGVASTMIEIDSSGEDKPAVVTDDGMKEARNRRVEATVIK